MEGANRHQRFSVNNPELFLQFAARSSEIIFAGIQMAGRGSVPATRLIFFPQSAALHENFTRRVAHQNMSGTVAQTQAVDFASRHLRNHPIGRINHIEQFMLQLGGGRGHPEKPAVCAGIMQAAKPLAARYTLAMKIFVDSANPAQWQTPFGLPQLAGATTNPSLVRQAGGTVSLAHYQTLVLAAQAMEVPHLMLQLPHASAAESLAWSQKLRVAACNWPVLTFKVACVPEAHALITALHEDGAEVLLTALANPLQLLWAADLGVRWVAPYLGRLEDAGRDPWPLVEACVAQQKAGGPRLLAASVRDEVALARVLALGAAAVTLPASFLAGRLEDPVTRQALNQFARDSA